MSDILNKISALRNKIPANGATEDEAIAALQIAQKLMERHGISEEDLKRVEFSRDMRSGSFTQKQKAIHPSQKYCGVKISEFCGIRCWVSEVEPRKKHLKMFGLNGDVEMAEFLLEMVHNSMDRGWKEFMKANPKTSESRHTQYWSFMMGFGERVNDRLEELMEAREVKVDSDRNDLVEVKMALVEQGMSAMLPDLRLKKRRSKGIQANMSAYQQGKTAGDTVNLSRPIQKQKSSVKRISQG
jgi:hypothetical protein